MSNPFTASVNTTAQSIPVAVAQHIQDELHLLQERLTEVSRQIETDPAFFSIIIFNKGIQLHIHIADILMIRSESNYSRFYLATDQEILSCRTLKYWFGKITHTDIKRTHASYMVNTKYIERVDKKQNIIMLKSGNVAKMSRRYKALF